MEAISEGQWNNYLSDEPDFMSQLLDNFSIPIHHQVPNDGDDNNHHNSSNLALSSVVWPSDTGHESYLNFGDGTMCYSSGGTNASSMHSSSHFFPTRGQEINHYFSGMMDCGTVEGGEHLSQDVSDDSFRGKSDLDLGKRVEKTIQEPPEEERSKKRTRIPRDVQRSKKLKSCPKIDKEKNNTNIDGASCSEDYSNELISGVASTSSSKKSEPLHLTGKTRASKGTATDPQSLYARKRRDRINERLRVLQNLVPNGTKVDISTMLEEAVQYVKFLQLQIKLLSSDDMWMYAPIAYNGMDLGLGLIIPTPASQS